MRYKVVPFTAKVSRNDTIAKVAEQVQQIIDEGATNGWKYLRMESVETSVAPNPGCFGIGAQPGFITSFQMLIFERSE